MSDGKYRKHAEELAEPLIDAFRMCVVKQHAAILEEMHDQLKARDAKIEQLKRTLGTCISWQQREFGEHGVNQLLEMLEEKT